MLENIRFRGFDVEGSSLKIHRDESEGGKFNVKFLEHEVVFQNDEDGNWIFVQVKPTATGYSDSDEDTENPVFEAFVALSLAFECNFKEDLEEDFHEKNSWFFENFVSVAAKIAIENLLKGSALETISLPWSPKF